MPAKFGVLRTILPLALVAGLFPGLFPGLVPGSSTLRADEPLEHFERRVRPLLIEKCASCHSMAAGKRKGGLWLDRREGWQVGGDSGPAIIPGEPGASLLFRAVSGTDPELRMPPDDPLTAAEIAALERWITDGAPDPREGGAETEEIDFEAALSHWAFRPMLDPPPPMGPGITPDETPIDAFLLAALAAEGLDLSAPADPRTLIRRVSIVLTGLPPTPEEVDAFLADRSPEAFARVVDRLLASPHFGERWGRMWLDLARFADSNGLDENLAFGNAWRYRDAVVDAWNSDKPYDRFVREQLAGDLLPPSGNEADDARARIATGFLSLGPKMLAEQDKEKLAIDIVDEQLDVAMQAFTGMTVGCARCHDHKFDPIPTTDYYAIAGIFRSTQTMQHFDHVSAWREAPVATAAEEEARKKWEAERKTFDARHAALESEITRALEGGWRSGVAEALLAVRANRDRVIHLEAEDAVETNLNTDRKQWGSPEVAVLHTHLPGGQFAEWEVHAPEPGRYRLSVRYAAMESRPMQLQFDGELLAQRVLAARTGGWLPPDQRWDDVRVLELGAGAHRLRLEREGAIPHLDRLRLVRVDAEDRPDLVRDAGATLPAEVIIGWGDFLARPERKNDPFFSAWLEFAGLHSTDLHSRDLHSTGLHSRDLHSTGLDAQTFSTEFPARAARLRARIGAEKNPLSPLVATLLDGAPPRDLRELAGRWQAFLAAIDPAHPEAGTGGEAKLEDAKPFEPTSAAALRRSLRAIDGPYSVALARRLELCPPELAARLEASRAQGKALAAREPAALPRAMAVADGKPIDLPVHVRGNHRSLAPEPTPRGALSITDPLVPPLVVPEGASGRRELAEWLLHPEHPLTARVMVNRVWQGLFGEGLVRTPSNFGLRGDTPSHPALLDRLARDFIADGWSTKRLIRRMVLTRAWQQGSDHESHAASVDPENRLLWRQNRRRLEAEWVRDGLLAVSGTLDREVGGTLLATRNRGYVTNDQSRNQARYDSSRRSIYLPVIRNAMYELFSAFDFNDPSVPVDRRNATVVAHQALFFLNAPLVLEAAEALAARTRGADSDRERIEQLTEHAWGRPPTAREVDRMQGFLAKALSVLEAEALDDGAAEAGLERAVPRSEARVESSGAPIDAAMADSNSDTNSDDAKLPPSTPQERAWQALAQAILAASEFTYFD